MDGDREGLIAFIELPLVHALAAVPEADALMVQHVARTDVDKFNRFAALVKLRSSATAKER